MDQQFPGCLLDFHDRKVAGEIYEPNLCLTREDYSVPRDDTVQLLFKGMHFKCNYMHNNRCEIIKSGSDDLVCLQRKKVYVRDVMQTKLH